MLASEGQRLRLLKLLAGLCTKVRYVAESAHFVPWLAY